MSPAHQLLADIIKNHLRHASIETGIPASKIHAPNRTKADFPARDARTRIWRALRRQGYSLQTIARAFNCHHSLICKHDKTTSP